MLRECKSAGSRLPEQARNRSPTVYLVTDAELANDLLLADCQDFLRKIRHPRRRFVDWLVDGVRDSSARLLDGTGNPVEIDYDYLEKDHFDLWVRDWITLRSPEVRRRVRAESRERVRLVITMLRMIFPRESAAWGLD